MKRYLPESEVPVFVRDMVKGRYFFSTQISEEAQIPRVFMVLAFVDQPMLDRMKEDDVVVFYEDLAARMPMGINGYPMFMSARMLTRSDWQAVAARAKSVEDALMKASEGA